jgi:hypothetical protein
MACVALASSGGWQLENRHINATKRRREAGFNEA